MLTLILNHTPLILRTLAPGDLPALHEYLAGLSDESKKRFGPHPFDMQALEDLFGRPAGYSAYIAMESGSLKIAAYSIIKMGFLEHDRHRLESYGLTLSPVTDATFAPSVADEWQGLGLGTHLFRFMLPLLQDRGIKRIILWGGVQCSNDLAVHYYRKLGFTTLGRFEYFGPNFDMILDVAADD